MTPIKNRDTDSVYEINEQTSFCDIEQACPLFFKTKHGKRETYSVYRGFLIVRNTVQFTGCCPERQTVVYAFCTLEKRPDLFCICANHLSSIRHAKKLIDKLLETREYYYGVSV